MSYTFNVPQASQVVGATQSPIQANFTYLNTALQVDHTFNNNAIAGEAAGSHQRLDFPNQGSDIASLGTGIAAVLYAIGGNLFSYNGSKQPVSAIAGTVSIQPTTMNAITIVTVPNDCIGMVIGPTSNSTAAQIGFFTVSSGTVVAFLTLSQTSSGAVYSFSGLTLQVQAVQSSYNSPKKFKYIMWPI
jgi:hypothetical protein